MQRLLLATIFLAVMGGIEASACMIVPFQIDFGSDTATFMQVGSGKRCSFTLHAAAQSAFSGLQSARQRAMAQHARIIQVPLISRGPGTRVRTHSRLQLRAPTGVAQ